jgi:REP element-mobilizing transposase RayT
MHHDFLPFIYYMRKKRFLLQHAEYHVTARVNRRETIFGSSEQKEMFLDVVKQARKKYRFDIHNFCILSTYFHWIIKPLKEENLSRIMQWILSVYAMRYNQKFKLVGHVFHDRFKSKVLFNFRQYIAAFIFMKEHPVEAHGNRETGKHHYNGINFMKNGEYEIIHPPDPAIRLVFPGIGQTLISGPGNK